MVLSGATGAVLVHTLDDDGTMSPQPRAERASDATPVHTLAGDPLDVATIVERVGPAVVNVQTRYARGPFSASGAGTGIILTADGQVVTNAHVVEGASTIQVTLAGSSQARPAHLVGIDSAADLALLQIDGATGLPTAPLGHSGDVRIGDDVVAIGNALALPGGPTVTRGIVSALGRSLQAGSSALSGLLQTDASISSGNSGGPLVDAAGRVIAINTAGAPSGGGTTAENIGFAIPIDSVLPVLDRLRGSGSTSTT
jgi:putative serine protease PepD